MTKSWFIHHHACPHWRSCFTCMIHFTHDLNAQTLKKLILNLTLIKWHNPQNLLKQQTTKSNYDSIQSHLQTSWGKGFSKGLRLTCCLSSYTWKNPWWFCNLFPFHIKHSCCTYLNVGFTSPSSWLQWIFHRL